MPSENWFGLVETGVTVIEAVLEMLPPVPEHVSVYELFAVGATLAEPEVVLLPLHAPDAVQVVTLVVLHVSVLDCPLTIDVGDADSVRVGVGVTFVTETVADCEMLPPAPVHVIV